MDGSRFDSLTRGLIRVGSRRGFVRLLGGLGLGGLFAGLGVDDTRAAKRLGGSPCTEDSQCQTGVCLSIGKCSCSRQFPRCRQPRNPCKQAKCAANTGRCVIRNRPAGAACPDDGNPCTRDVCDGDGRCTHPAQEGATCADDGKPCTRNVCSADGQCIHPNTDDLAACPEGICQDGTCLACTAVGDLCDSAGECCPHRGGQPGCQRGDGGFCGPISFKTCCSGVDGPCGSSCDCCGDAPCEGGTCGCPAGTQRSCDQFGGCVCCPNDRANYCGGGCCPLGKCRFCPPFGGSCYCL